MNIIFSNAQIPIYEVPKYWDNIILSLGPALILNPAPAFLTALIFN